jgi:hypothetical protein
MINRSDFARSKLLGQELINKIQQLRDTEKQDFNWFVTCKIFAGGKIKMTMSNTIIPVTMEYISIK